MNVPTIHFQNHRNRFFPAVLGGCLMVSLLAQAQTNPPPKVALKLVAEGMTAPIALSPMPDGSGRLLIADQLGTVRVIDKDGKLVEEPVLDVQEKIVKRHQGMEERGILGLALHPDFNTNHKLYISYSTPLRADGPQGFDNTILVSEFQTDVGTPLKARMNSERVLLQIDKPDWNHNSGRIGFGPDGFLYMTVGDGGAPNDVGEPGHPHAAIGNGQTLTTLLGKMLRIDVNGNPHGIPKDNPFADGKNGLPEIYAYGLRNPWGFSWDRGGSHELFLADVGQDAWEEINIITKGGNYGWRVKEGFSYFDPNNSKVPLADGPKVGADGKPFIDPILVYRNKHGFPRDPEAKGSTVVGGYVYRGKAFPNLVGKYIFGDWAKTWVRDGQIFVATRPDAPSKTWTMEKAEIEEHPTGDIGAFLWAYGEDNDGELYLLTNGANMVSGARGKVYKLVPPKM